MSVYLYCAFKHKKFLIQLQQRQDTLLKTSEQFNLCIKSYPIQIRDKGSLASRVSKAVSLFQALRLV